MLNNKDQRNYYQILNISQNATANDIKKAYHNKALEHHPDKNTTDNTKAAEEEFKKINAAYSVLKDEHKRKEYDAELSQHGNVGNSQQQPQHKSESPFANGKYHEPPQSARAAPSSGFNSTHQGSNPQTSTQKTSYPKYTGPRPKDSAQKSSSSSNTNPHTNTERTNSSFINQKTKEYDSFDAFSKQPKGYPASTSYFPRPPTAPTASYFPRPQTAPTASYFPRPQTAQTLIPLYYIYSNGTLKSLTKPPLELAAKASTSIRDIFIQSYWMNLGTVWSLLNGSANVENFQRMLNEGGGNGTVTYDLNISEAQALLRSCNRQENATADYVRFALIQSLEEKNSRKTMVANHIKCVYHNSTHAMPSGEVGYYRVTFPSFYLGKDPVEIVETLQHIQREKCQTSLDDNKSKSGIRRSLFRRRDR